MVVRHVVAILAIAALLVSPSRLCADGVGSAKNDLPADASVRMGDARLQDAGAILLSPDGKTLISASFWSVGFWDVATGTERRRIHESFGGMGQQLRFPDGKTLACGGGNPNFALFVFDVATGKELHRISHNRELTAAAFAADGRLLLTAPPSAHLPGHENFVRAFDVTSGKEAWKVPAISFAVLADNKTVAVIKPRKAPGDKNWLELYDLDTGAEKKRFPLEEAGWCNKVEASPDGKLLAIVDEGRIQITLWDLAAEKTVRVIRDAGAPLAFSPDGRNLSYANIPNGIRGPERMNLVNASTGEAMLSFGKGVFAANFTRNCKTLVAPASGSDAIALWDLDTKKERPLVPARGLTPRASDRWNPEMANLSAFSADGKTLVTSLWCADSPIADGAVRRIQIWDVATGKERLAGEGHQGRITHVAFDSSGKVVFSASKDKTLRWWDAAEGKELRRFAEKHTPAAVSLDGKTAASFERGLLLWDTATGKEIQQFDAPKIEALERGQSSTRVALSPDGRTVAWCIGDNVLHLFDVADRKRLHSLRGHERVGSGPNTYDPYQLGIVDLSFSPDAKKVLSRGVDGAFRLWDVTTGKSLWVIPFHGESQHRTWMDGASVSRMNWAQDGNRIVVTDTERKEAFTLDADDGKERGRYRLEGLSVESVALSADGNILAYSNVADQTYGHAKNGSYPIILVDAAEGKVMRRLTGHRIRATAMAFAPNGQALVSAGEDGALVVWDLTRDPKQ